MHERLILVAIAAALSLAACQQEAKRPAPTQATAQQPQSGKDIFEYRCAFCHGVTGAGDSPTASGYPNANLTDGAWAYGQTREDVVRTITNGVPGTPMRGFGDVMTKEEIAAVADYVMHLNGR
jgi:cytochrome c oxidase cbb3-type subunit 3